MGRPGSPLAPQPTRIGYLLASIAVLIVAAGAAYIATRRRPAPAPAAAPPPQVVPTSAPALPTVPAELPKPEIGVDAKAAPTAAPAAAIVPTSPPKPAPPRRFAVQFSSIPPATLSVDGRTIGPSVPAQRVELEEGTHRYRFEAKGLPTFDGTLKVTASGAPPVAYQFPIGSLVLQADPSWIGASIIVDGKYKATVQSATERVRLAPGSHRLIVLREGFRPATREITIEKGADVTWAPPAAVPVDAGG